jgi:small-conductance mechanosensitive channel
MQEFQPKVIDRIQSKLQNLPVSYKTIATSLAVLILSAGVFAFSQQLSKLTSDTQARGRDVLAHLNASIRFYRTSITPIQKAGEPNDSVYRDQTVAFSLQAAGLAFQSAKAEAALMTAYQGQQATLASGQQQRMQASEANVEKQLSDLKAREDALDREIASAKPKQIEALRSQRKQIEAALALANAMKDALQKIVGISDLQGATGLAADIDRLQRTVPELDSKVKEVAPPISSLGSVHTSGVSSQAMMLFDLFQTRRSLDSLIRDNENLHKQALALRTPISTLLRSLIGQGQQLSQQAAAPVVPAPASAAAKDAVSSAVASVAAQQSLQTITNEFKALAAASVPLSEEIIVLEQNAANLTAWQTSVDREYKSVLHFLLGRLVVIAIALAIILGCGEIWRHATNKYIRDIRRRRQILIVRRVVVGFLSALVVLFGFVTQFNSLATFAGFITAGIAVGLQTILLSVAAYFFIIGRYGVKVGDRITIAAVTGDVIDVGLVRFYMMELAGNGSELNPTGRVAVFSNAVLFQAGTPLYKQMPGTEFAWHELTVKLADTANYKMVCEAILKEVDGVYAQYKTSIEQQHQYVENWMQTSITPPTIETRLQFNNGAIQLWVRFPVQIKHASQTDEQLTQALLGLMMNRPEIKAAVTSMPVIQASVKG